MGSSEEVGGAARGPRAGGLAPAVALVTGATVASRLLGFVREAVVAGVFGASPEVDAFLVAQGVPNVVIALAATAVVTAMTPQLAADVAAGEHGRASTTFRTVGAAVVALVVVGTALLWAGAPALVRALAPGFDAELARLATDLTRVVLLAAVLVAVTNLLAALLHALRRFAHPALEGVPFNVVMICAAWLFGETHGVRALAVAFVVGSVARLVLQLVGLRDTGIRLRGSLAPRSPDVRRVAGLVPTVVVSHVVSNVNNLVDRVVASTVGPGAISALGFGWRLVALPQGLLTQALVTVVYPSLGELAAADPDAGRRLLRGATRVILVLLVPVVAVTVVLAEDVVTVVYARGAFDAEDVASTATALRWFAPGLLAGAVRDLGLRGLYARGDRRRPLWVAGLGGATNVVGDVALGPVFGIAGLAAATSLSQAASAAAALRATDLLAGAGRRAVRAAAVLTVAALVAALAVRGAAALLGGPGWTGAATRVGVGGLLALGAVLVVVALLDRSLLTDLPRPRRRRGTARRR